MSTVCDSCKETVRADDGCARIVITDPTLDFSIGTLTMNGMPTLRRPPDIDLCAACLTKLISVLGLPTDTFIPRAPLAESAAGAESAAAPVGALSLEDLVKLGLAE